MSRRKQRSQKDSPEIAAAPPEPPRGRLGGSKARRWIAAGAAVAVLSVMGWLVWGGSAETPPTAEFVGSAACVSCHQEEGAAWKGSQHDRAMQHARPGTVLADFDSSSYTYGDVTSTFLRRGDRFFVRTDASDGALRDFEVKYTFGVEPLQQYLIELPNGHVQPLSIAWDSRPRGEGGQRWFHLYPGEGIDHTDELHWSGRRQNWNFMCADCHSTNVRKGYDAGADAFRTTWSEMNVGCEACHGPGSGHRRWAESPRLLRAILWRGDGLPVRLDEREGVRWAVGEGGKPARSEPRATDREVRLCAQCHSLREQVAEGFAASGARLGDHYSPSAMTPGVYHADGQQRGEVYVFGSFLQSRMYHAGVTCSDCHEPHSQRLRAPGNALCAQCHTPARYDSPAHTFHPAGSQGAQCVSCHMPATTYMEIDARRDHGIRVPRPDQSVALGVPNACTQCHADRGDRWAADELRRLLGRDPTGFQSFAVAFHADEQGLPGAAEGLRGIAGDPAQPAFVRASALARLAGHAGSSGTDAAALALRDPDFMVRRAAVEVLERLPGRQRIDLVAPLLRDSSRVVRIEAAWALAGVSAGLSASDRDAFGRASEEYVAAQRLNADRPEGRLRLGDFFVLLGRVAEATAEYRGAIRLAPGQAAGYVQLADLLRAAGREEDAERTLREGLARAGDVASLHHALGLSLARSGRTDDAVGELQRAASLGPENAVFAYAYAVALHSSGRAAEAIRVLEGALERHPSDRDLLFALATFHRDAGRREEAIAYAAALAKSFPEDGEGRALLQSLRAP